jgi:glycosyltransferase involved in cell wall biosynthesis
MKISVAMIVKNEEEMLARCLETVKEADEIIICDTGSEDKTVEIAKTFTDKVYTDFKWIDHFGKARQHSKDKCTGDWIVTIDADEVLECPFSHVREVIEAAEKGGYHFVNVQTVANKVGTSNVFPRIYKNLPEITWHGAAHNYLRDNGEVAGKSLNSDIRMIYDNSPAHAKDPDRTLRILTKAVMEDRTLSREKFYLAREHFYRNQWGEAIFWYQEYLENPGFEGEEAQAWYMLGRCFYYRQRKQDAYNALLRAVLINPNFKDAIFFIAQIAPEEKGVRWMEFAEGADNSGVLFATFPAQEKDAVYYDRLFENDTDMSRYEEILKMIGQSSEGKKVLDIGCGLAELSQYVNDYSGFDISEKAVKQAKKVAKNVWVGSAYDKKNFKKADIYVATEVLEHIKGDRNVLRNIPSGKDIIVSVPSFADPSHIRVFNDKFFRKRYEDLLEIQDVARFNWDDKARRWVFGGPLTSNYILLYSGVRK